MVTLFCNSWPSNTAWGLAAVCIKSFIILEENRVTIQNRGTVLRLRSGQRLITSIVENLPVQMAPHHGNRSLHKIGHGDYQQLMLPLPTVKTGLIVCGLLDGNTAPTMK